MWNSRNNTLYLVLRKLKDPSGCSRPKFTLNCLAVWCSVDPPAIKRFFLLMFRLPINAGLVECQQFKLMKTIDGRFNMHHGPFHTVTKTRSSKHRYLSLPIIFLLLVPSTFRLILLPVSVVAIDHTAPASS